MSNVTDIIMITMIEDGAESDDKYPNMDKLNEYLEKHQGISGDIG